MASLLSVIKQSPISYISSLFSKPKQDTSTGLVNSAGQAVAVPKISTSPSVTISMPSSNYNPWANQTTTKPTTSFGNLMNNGQVLGVSTTSGGSGNNGSNVGTNSLVNTNPPDVSGGVDDAALDAMYQGAQTAYNNQENSLRSQLPLMLQQLATSGDEQKAPYTQKQQEGEAQLALNEKQTKDAEQNAYQQARQLFNELSQYNLSRFGTGSSAGQAAMELLGRSTNQNFNQVSNNAQDNLQKIADSKKQLVDFVSTQKALIDKQVKDKTDQAQQWFQDQLNQINSNRAMLESDKAAKRYDALQQRQNFVNQLADQEYTYRLNLSTWQQQQLNSMQQTAQQYTTPQITADKLIQQALANQTNVPRAKDQTGAVSNPSTYGSTSNLMPKYQKVGNVWMDVANNRVVTPEEQYKLEFDNSNPGLSLQ
jgi:hypothetical protein